MMKDNKKILNEIGRIRELMGLDFSLIAEQNQKSSVEELYKSKNLKALVDMAEEKDPVEVKSHPIYKTVMDWWRRGFGTGAFPKKEGPTKFSLTSLYYWNGGKQESISYDNTRTYIVALGTAEILLNYLNSLKDNSKVNTDDLETGINLLKQEQEKGFLLSDSNTLRDLFQSLLHRNDIEMYVKSKNTEKLKSIFNNISVDGFTKKVNNLIGKKKEGKIWAGSVSMDAKSKINFLDSINKSAENKAKKEEKEVNELINKAQYLYILKRGAKIDVIDSEPEIGEPIRGSYPPDANGDTESEAFKLGKAMFPDDGITLSSEAVRQINDTVKSAVSEVKSIPGVKIVNVSIWGYSSTSKVPTKYKSETEGVRSEVNNKPLAEDRLLAINKALSEAFKSAGLDVEPKINEQLNKADPNRGPEWTDKQRNDTKTYGTPGNRTETYEKTYGDYRYARAFFEINYELEEKSAPEVTIIGNWQAVIKWRSKPQKGGGGGGPVIRGFKGTGPLIKYNGSCPMFGN